MQKSTLRQEFEKFCIEQDLSYNEAVEGAKWMAYKLSESILSVPDRIIIRRLAKELES